MKLRIRLGIAGMFFLCIIVAAIIGWGMNIYKLTKCDFEAPYKAEIVRGLGVFPVVPMGAIVGWMDIDDTATVRRVMLVE